VGTERGREKSERVEEWVEGVKRYYNNNNNNIEASRSEEEQTTSHCDPHRTLR
jgi:hypothetical protein